MSGLLSKYIVAGNKIELQAVRKGKNEADQEEKKQYTTQVYDILSEDQIELLMPMEGTKLVLLPLDGEYDLCFYTENGLFQCFARVIDRFKEGNVYVVVMELTSNLRKHQRREYYRFSCALEMNSRELSANEELAVETDQNYKLEPGLPLKRSVIVDISGGGLRFAANHRYEKGSTLLCRYSLLIEGEKREYNLIGKVLEVKESENRQGVYEHRVQYRNMDAETREEIIRYIFNEERKHRRKERGMY